MGQVNSGPRSHLDIQQLVKLQKSLLYGSIKFNVGNYQLFISPDLTLDLKKPSSTARLDDADDDTTRRRRRDEKNVELE